MTTYITTDTHFNHAKILEFCKRPADYEQRIFGGFLDLKKTDTLIHLGDINIGKDEECHAQYIQPLSCFTVLVKGNHDNKSNHWYRCHGWNWVCETFSDTYFGVKVLFSHRPMPWDGFFDVNIHGHLHDLTHRKQERRNKLNFLISLEEMGYTPLSLESILGPIKAKMNEGMEKLDAIG